jgi:hypothetical protein
MVRGGVFKQRLHETYMIRILPQKQIKTKNQEPEKMRAFAHIRSTMYP